MSLRLDISGDIIRCGVTSCGAAVGERAHGRVLALLPGYARDADGTVRMSPRSVRRMRRGQYPRPLRSSWVQDGSRNGLRPGPLPLRVKCWRCDWVHTADPRTLQVEDAEHDAWIAWNWVND